MCFFINLICNLLISSIWFSEVCELYDIGFWTHQSSKISVQLNRKRYGSMMDMSDLMRIGFVTGAVDSSFYEVDKGRIW